MAARKTEIIVTGRSTGAVRALNDVGTAAQRNAKTSEAAFNRTTSRIGGAFGKLDGVLGQFGLPFAGALGAMGSRLDKTEAHGRGLGKTLSNIGGVEAAVAGAGLLAFGSIAVHAALEGEQAHARLETAVHNAGGAFGDYAGRISAVSDKLAGFGFTNDEVESSIAALVPATKNVGHAIELQGLAANIARQRNISLADATKALVAVEGGRFSRLGKLLGLTKDQVASIHSVTDAERLLTKITEGAAARSTDTFSGKMRALSAEGHNLAETVGNALIPQIEHLASGALATVHGLEAANDATGGWLGKIALAGAAIPVAVFAIDKLVGGVKAVGTAYGKAGDFIGRITGLTRTAAEADTAAATAIDARVAAEEALTGASAERTAAEAAESEATAGVLAANATYTEAVFAQIEADTALEGIQASVAAGAIELGSVQEALAAGFADAALAADALAASEGVVAGADATLVAAHAAVATATEGVTAAEAQLAAANTAEALEQIGAAGVGAAAGLGTVAAAFAPIVAAGAGLFYLKTQVDEFDSKVRKAAKGLLDVGDAASRAQTQLGHLIGNDNAAEVKHYSDLLLSNADAQTLAAARAQTTADVQRRVATEMFGAGRAAKLTKDDIQALTQTNEVFNNKVAEQAGHIDTAERALKGLVDKYGEAGVKTLELANAEKVYADLLAKPVAPDDLVAQHNLATAHDAVVAAKRADATIQGQVNAAVQEGADQADHAAVNIDKQAEATKEAAKAEKEHTAALDALGKVAGPATEALVKGVGLSTQAVTDLKTNIDSLDSAVDSGFGKASTVIEDFTQAGAVDIRKFNDELLHQVAATQNWSANIQKLSQLHLNTDFLKGLVEQGPKAATEVQAIVDGAAHGEIQLINNAQAAILRSRGDTNAALNAAATDAATASARQNALMSAANKQFSADTTRDLGKVVTMLGNVKDASGNEALQVRRGAQVGREASAAHALLGATLKSVADHAREEADRQAILAGKTANATGEHRAQLQALRDLEAKFPALKGQIETYIGTLGLIKPSVNTVITVDTSEALRRIEQLRASSLAALGSLHTTSIVTFPGRAAGGDVTGDSPYIVGEKGPELFVPDQSGTIIPNHRLGGMFAAGGKPPVGIASLVGEAGPEVFVPSVFTGITLGQSAGDTTSSGASSNAIDYLSQATGLVSQADGSAAAFMLLAVAARDGLVRFTKRLGQFKKLGFKELDSVLVSSGEQGIRLADDLARHRDLARRADRELGGYKAAVADFDKKAASFGGKRADGGPVTKDKTYLVGERGPERFVPHGARTTGTPASGGARMSVPAGAHNTTSIGGGTMTVNLTVNALDPKGAEHAVQQVVVDALKGWSRRNGPVPVQVAG